VSLLDPSGLNAMFDVQTRLQAASRYGEVYKLIHPARTRMGAAVSYRIDTQKSLFTVHPFATGLAATLSHGLTIAIRDFTGVIRFVPETLEQASLQMRIRSGSLTVTDSMKDDDRREVERTMKQHVLRTVDYPEIAFDSTSVVSTKLGGALRRVDVTGDLTLTGRTQAHSFSAQVVLGGDTLRANGDFKALQSDYGIPLISAGAGLIKLHDEIKLHFYIVAEKQA
jgi:polyisoprenoid-binding protein YceI